MKYFGKILLNEMSKIVTTAVVLKRSINGDKFLDEYELIKDVSFFRSVMFSVPGRRSVLNVVDVVLFVVNFSGVLIYQIYLC